MNNQQLNNNGTNILALKYKVQHLAKLADNQTDDELYTQYKELADKAYIDLREAEDRYWSRPQIIPQSHASLS